VNDNVVELKPPAPLAHAPEAFLDLGDLRFSLDADDGWVYIEDPEDELAVLALNGDEAVALRDWLIQVLPA
jgi:hypothetical protein